MALESLENRIDIKNLGIENLTKPERLKFDPDLEFDENDKTNISSLLASTYDMLDKRNFHQAALATSILFPDQKKELVELNEETWETALYYRRDYNKAPEPLAMAEAVAEIKLLYPEHEVKMDNEQWSFLMEHLNIMYKAGHYGQFGELAKSLAIVRPVEMHKFLRSNEDYWQGIKKVAEGSLKLFGTADESELEFVSDRLARARLLFPEQFHELVLNESTWISMHQKFRRLKQRGIATELLQSAANLKILTANDVAITAKGIEINNTSPQTFGKDPAVPEQRKF